MEKEKLSTLSEEPMENLLSLILIPGFKKEPSVFTSLSFLSSNLGDKFSLNFFHIHHHHLKLLNHQYI